VEGRKRKINRLLYFQIKGSLRSGPVKALNISESIKIIKIPIIPPKQIIIHLLSFIFLFSFLEEEYLISITIPVGIPIITQNKQINLRQFIIPSIIANRRFELFIKIISYLSNYEKDLFFISIFT
jgi:hypothetical protein